MARHVVVIGAGIVGVSVARELARFPSIHVTVLEANTEGIRGSTAFAPGYVGLYNESRDLTELARSSAAIYETAALGFRQTGGIEVATTPAGAAGLELRAQGANAAGLPARMIAADQLPPETRDLVDPSRIVAALHYATDGVAEPLRLTAALRASARERGAEFANGTTVVGIDPERNNIRVTTEAGSQFLANDVVLAGGVWGPSLTGLLGIHLPLFPVAHPYVYSGHGMRAQPGPFVRWPEHHVYARVHHDRIGIGSYDHRPVPVTEQELTAGARLSWASDFDPIIHSAQQLLRPDLRFEAEDKINGVFAMTPDNLPYIGAVPGRPGMWMAHALWITHAAGAAAVLAGGLAQGQSLPAAFAVDRFGDRSQPDLRDAALRLYRDIYANHAEPF